MIENFFLKQINFLPDITPTGSLRRRRSRVLSEEDDNNLMDFLRSSANENNSRKTSSYGSLDRSWARRARSGSNSKKRPDLLNIDFSLERERPVSPANMDAANRVAHEDARPRYGILVAISPLFPFLLFSAPNAFSSKHIYLIIWKAFRF